MRSNVFVSAFLATFIIIAAQQFEGERISAFLPTLPRMQVAFFKIKAPRGDAENTLINYQTLGSDGRQVANANISRALVVVHGLLRDPWNYCNDTLNALEKATTGDPNINQDSVVALCPYFANGEDKSFGYPWDNSADPGNESFTNALVWSGSQWSAGADNHYPHRSRHTSSFYVMDKLIEHFDDISAFPNLKQIVLVGHSLGGQTLQRYAAVGDKLHTRVPVTYWIGNPDSYSWLSNERPLSTTFCKDNDDYRDGFSNYVAYSNNMTYGVELVSEGRQAILSNYNRRQIAYGRALHDRGNQAQGCAPMTQGIDRNERFFFFIKAFPPSCNDPAGDNCDTVDLIPVSHDNGQMFGSDAGLARLFIDNFYGDGKRAYDFGYPRKQRGDDPFPDPAKVGISGITNFNVYTSENFTYQGCWTDQSPVTKVALPVLAFDNSSNTQQTCAEACVEAGYSIAGVENHSQCRCGNALDSSSAVLTVDNACYFNCTGNSKSICGGPSRISILSKASQAPY